MTDKETLLKQLKAKNIPQARRVSPATRKVILAQAGKPTMPPAVPDESQPEATSSEDA